MNTLFACAGGNLNTLIAQLALFLGLKEKGVNIYLIGNFSDEIKNYIREKDATAEFYDLYPSKKLDKEYQQKLSDLITAKNIELIHFITGNTCRNGMLTLKKHPKVKTVVYFGSTSLHWHDPAAYLTYLHPRIDAIIGNSNFVYNHIKKQLFGKNKQKAVRIFKGYDADWFNTVSPFDYSKIGIPSNALVVCTAGDHRKVKGTKYFLKSSAFVNSQKEIHYVLIGENTDAPHLMKIKNKSPAAQRIHILGKRNDVFDLLAGAHIYVQASLSEGFGRAISEAMSLGKPVIMTNAGGCTELIDETSGIVVPLKNYKAIGNAITELADNDTLRKKMGEKAKERIQNIYNIKRTVKETLDLYTKLLKK